VPDQKSAIFVQTFVKAVHQMFSSFTVEVNHHVSAENAVKGFVKGEAGH
jgi:hypothetical protein